MKMQVGSMDSEKPSLSSIRLVEIVVLQLVLGSRLASIAI